MKKLFCLFLFLYLVSGALATSFSPSNLVFSLEKNEVSCKLITLSSESSKVIVSDKWAESLDLPWEVASFTSEAEDHSIIIDYESEVITNELEVCLSGERVGEFHGVVLLKEEEEEGSVIQMGVWVKLTVKEEEEEEINEGEENNQVSSGGGSGGSVKKTENESSEVLEENRLKEEEERNEGEIKKVEVEEEERNTLITGGVVGARENSKVIMIASLVVLFGLGLFVSIKRRKKSGK